MLRSYRAIVKELENYPFLQDLEAWTGLKKVTLLSLTGPTLLYLRFAGFGPEVVCNLVGFTYPAIASLRAIKSKGTNDDTQWLTYWTVFASLNLVEAVFLRSLILAFPFYFAFKFGLLIWAQAPSSRGAVFVYSHLLAPFLKNHTVHSESSSS